MLLRRVFDSALVEIRGVSGEFKTFEMSAGAWVLNVAGWLVNT